MAWHNRRPLILASLLFGLATSSLAQQLGPATESESNSIIGSPPQPSAAPAVIPPFAALHRFPGTSGVYDPSGGLAMDGAGNLYGTTLYGHDSDDNCQIDTCGVVYRLEAPTWTYKLLHAGILFEQGIAPKAPLTIVGDVIYGTMSAGGSRYCACGVVFKILTNGTGYQEFHVFGPNFPAKQVKGATPIGGLLIDGDTMYGTTSAGGKYGNGVVYKLSTDGSGYEVLHHFTPDNPAYVGEGPQGELLLGKDGRIYGTQFGGGKYNQGTVFRISKTGDGFEVLHDFANVFEIPGVNDGGGPQGRLAQGSDGTIYGATELGGTALGYGTAWSLKPVGDKWVYKQLRRFTVEDRNDANTPHSGLEIDTNGVLYGAGGGGGQHQCGAVYKLTPPKTADGKWGYDTLYSDQCFPSDPDGDLPDGDLLLHNHLLYGVNAAGGPNTVACSNDTDIGCGAVFRIKP
jgi:uncharacterized repeat protein (TIGR03803 family)